MRTLLTTTTITTIMHVFNISTTFSITINPTEIKLDNDIMIYELQINVSIIETIIKKKILIMKKS